jgi:hypothetical protein
MLQSANLADKIINFQPFCAVFIKNTDSMADIFHWQSF